jgi:hypothetical protein
MKKTLQIGKMYKTPWKVTAYGDVYISEETEYTTFNYNDRVDLADGAYVVLLEITTVRRRFYNMSNLIESYILKILTGAGDVRYLACTQAGMDYWKRCPPS